MSHMSDTVPPSQYIIARFLKKGSYRELVSGEPGFQQQTGSRVSALLICSVGLATYMLIRTAFANCGIVKFLATNFWSIISQLQVKILVTSREDTCNLLKELQISI